jgi:hypothetical protein
MTKKEFVSTVPPVTVLIDGKPVEVDVREFSTGSVGFRFDGKVPYTLPDGTKGELSCSGNIVLIGSKKMPSGEDKAAA